MTLRAPIPAKHFQWHIAALSLVASAISVWLFLQGASDEPYVYFRRYDAATQLGLGSVMLALWTYLIAAVIYGLSTKRIHPTWSGLLLWGLIVLFYLSTCVFGYLEDLTRYLPEVRE